MVIRTPETAFTQDIASYVYGEVIVSIHYCKHEEREDIVFTKFDDFSHLVYSIRFEEFLKRIPRDFYDTYHEIFERNECYEEIGKTNVSVSVDRHLIYFMDRQERKFASDIEILINHFIS